MDCAYGNGDGSTRRRLQEKDIKAESHAGKSKKESNKRSNNIKVDENRSKGDIKSKDDADDLDATPIKFVKSEEEAKAQYEEEWAATCNSLYVDFINHVGCPVDAFYGGTVSYEDDPGLGVQGHDFAKAAMGGTGPTCAEIYSFHLGTNPRPVDYISERDTSPVFSIGTYLTHRFLFRLHSDADVVVDEHIVSPTVVRDCPERSVRTAKAMSGLKDGIATEGQVLNGKEQGKEGKVDIVSISSSGEHGDFTPDRVSEGSQKPGLVVNISEELLESVLLNVTNFRDGDSKVDPVKTDSAEY